MAAFAWAGLRRFQNVDLVAKRLTEIHEVPLRYHDHVKKQALQIRYCLVQAREYFSAASVVTPATKPNLLYYGTMSLALAEILFKQSGDSSLDRARSQNRHHGLSMSAAEIPKAAGLWAAANSLRARPHEVTDVRRGTFELWHRSSREHPLAGFITNNAEQGSSTTSYDIVLNAIDQPYAPLPSAGISLAECLQGIPSMMEYLEATDVQSMFVRGKCQTQIWRVPDQRSQIEIVFHPSSYYDKLMQIVRVDPKSVNQVNVFEGQNWCVVRLLNDPINGLIDMPLPPGATLNTDEWRMWINSPSLNEFGYLYVSLFLGGNYARYFPDKWLSDVETSTPLALAIEELCVVADWRVPWLALCELDETLYVPEV